MPDNQMLILATGVQGEPRSALNRMAQGEHRQIQRQAGDTIIVSGGTIPGNEVEVGRMLNKLFELGANVIYGKLANVHVSGHGSRDEMATMIKTVKPKFFMPVHGETRHLHLHARLAAQPGHGAGKRVHAAKRLCLGHRWPKSLAGEPVAAGDVLVDGQLVGDVARWCMRDRQRLSQDGFIVALIPVNSHNQLAGEPEIISRGFVAANGSKATAAACPRTRSSASIRLAPASLHEAVRNTLQEFFYRETQSRPVVLPSIIRV